MNGEIEGKEVMIRMNKTFFFHLILNAALLWASTSYLAEKNISFENITLTQVYGLLKKYPEFGIAPKEYHGVVDYQTLHKLVSDIMRLQKNTLKSGTWFENRKPSAGWWEDPYTHFSAYAQKISVAPSAEIAFWGDIHGSAHSLMRTLLWLKNNGYLNDDFIIKKPNFYIVLLGDLVDRGGYSIEVLFVLFTLKHKNPEHVFFVRGNHDDITFREKFNVGPISLYNDLKNRLLLNDNQIRSVFAVFEYFPVVIYVQAGTNIIQASHGAFEIGYTPARFLESSASYDYLSEIKRKTMISQFTPEIRQEIIQAVPAERIIDFKPTAVVNKLPDARWSRGIKIGFVWHEFDAVKDHPNIIELVSGEKKDREFIYNEKLTKYIMNNVYSTSGKKVRLMIRGHQHHDQMLDELIKHKGFVNSWGSVYTLFSGPANFFWDKTIFPYDSFIILKLSPLHEQWKVNHIVHPVP